VSIWGWLGSALLPAIGAVVFWLLRDRPLPGETGPLGFSPPVRRRFYIGFSVTFAVMAVATVVAGVVTAS
jgi:hypothetical protein